MCSDEWRAVPDLVPNVGDKNDGSSEVGLEETSGDLVGGQITIANGPDSSPELGNENQHVEDESDPRANNARLAPERELVQGVALLLPRLAEADVCEAD